MVKNVLPYTCNAVTMMKTGKNSFNFLGNNHFAAVGYCYCSSTDTFRQKIFYFLENNHFAAVSDPFYAVVVTVSCKKSMIFWENNPKWVGTPVHGSRGNARDWIVMWLMGYETKRGLGYLCKIGG